MDWSFVTNVKLVWFHTFVTQVITDNIVMWVTRLSIVDWVCSKTLILLGTLRTQSQPREGSTASVEVEHSSPSVACASNKTSVSHSSTESESMSLDVGLRMDGLLALDLWDVMIEVLRSSNSTTTPNEPAAGNCSRNRTSKPKQKGNRDVDHLSHVDYVTTNAKFCSRWGSVVHVWWPWSSDHNDHQGQNSNDETRVKNPQSCSWLVFRQNQFGPQDPNQIRWHQKPTRRHVWTPRSKSNTLTPKTSSQTC